MSYKFKYEGVTATDVGILSGFLQYLIYINKIYIFGEFQLQEIYKCLY
jgi:hypothetical protein